MKENLSSLDVQLIELNSFAEKVSASGGANEIWLHDGYWHARAETDGGTFLLSNHDGTSGTAALEDLLAKLRSVGISHMSLYW